jgi:ribose transport system permease protein
MAEMLKRKLSQNHLFISLSKSNAIGVLAIILFTCIGMSLTQPEFATVVNFNVIVRSFSVTAIVGLAQMIIIGMGGMNLSLGAIGGLAGVTAGGFMAILNWPVSLALCAGLAVGALCGLINGLLINRIHDGSGKLNVSSFLVTLASTSVFVGINKGMTRAVPIYGLDEGFVNLGRMTVGGVSVLLFILIPVVLGVYIIINKTSIGRQILAVGGNSRAAGLSGISIGKVTIASNTISGILAAIAAIIVLARLGSAQPTVGEEWLLFSFAAPLIGGTRLEGGRVNILGTVLGAVLLSLVANSLIHLNVSAYWVTFIYGLIIIAAVGIERIRAISAEKWGE